MTRSDGHFEKYIVTQGGGIAGRWGGQEETNAVVQGKDGEAWVGDGQGDRKKKTDLSDSQGVQWPGCRRRR